MRLIIIILLTNISLLYPYASSINYMETHSIYLRKSIADYSILDTRDYTEYGFLFSIPKIKKYMIDIGFTLKNDKMIDEITIISGVGSEMGTEEFITTVKSRSTILNLHSPSLIASFTPVVSYRYEVETYETEFLNFIYDNNIAHYRTVLSIYLKRNLSDRYFFNVGYSGIKSRSEYPDVPQETISDDSQRSQLLSESNRDIPDVVSKVGTNGYTYKFGFFELALHYKALEKLQFSGTLGKALGHDTFSFYYSFSIRMYF